MQGVSRAQDLIHTRIDLYLRVTGVVRGIAGSTEEMVAGRRSRTTRPARTINYIDTSSLVRPSAVAVVS